MSCRDYIRHFRKKSGITNNLGLFFCLCFVHFVEFIEKFCEIEPRTPSPTTSSEGTKQPITKIEGENHMITYSAMKALLPQEKNLDTTPTPRYLREHAHPLYTKSPITVYHNGWVLYEAQSSTVVFFANSYKTVLYQYDDSAEFINLDSLEFPVALTLIGENQATENLLNRPAFRSGSHVSLEESGIAYLIADPDADTENQVFHHLFWRSLDKTEKYLLRHHYFMGETLETISARLEINRHALSKILQNIFNKFTKYENNT